MNICLIRHADALALAEGAETSDAERPLTDKGWRQCHALAAALRRVGLQPGALVVSPLLRSRQTAEGLLARWSGAAPEVLEWGALAPGGKPRTLEGVGRRLELEAVGAGGQ